MLKSLYIKNFTLLEELKIEFGTDFNVLTGETGAGKSIIIEAINLLLGERAEKDFIGTYSDQCVIEAEFNLNKNPQLSQFLKENDLSDVETSSMIIRRVISNSGSSRQFINDIPVNVSLLKQMKKFIVDIHSADEHQVLLNPDHQLLLLDRYAGLDSQKQEYENIFIKYVSILKEIEELRKIENEEAERQLEFLKGQIQEFKDEIISPEEEQALIEEHKFLSNREEIYRIGSEVLNKLSDNEFSVMNNIAYSKKAFLQLDNLGIDEARNWQDDIEEIASKIRELIRKISSKIFDNEFDESRFKWLEDRLTLYYKFKRKFGHSLEEALKNFQSIKEKIAFLEKRSETIKAKERELNEIKAQLMKAGKELSTARKNAAKKISQGVLKNMKQLGLNNAAFSISVSEENEPNKNGYNKVEFMFSANAGIEEAPLRDVASSGEISRAILAIKSFLADYEEIPTIIFDEIDVNIGGITANRVAEKLQQLARSHQLICITHLPQVASRGNHHFVVSKITKNNQTSIKVSKVIGNDRIKEIARMLGGTENSSVAIKHAEELLMR